MFSKSYERIKTSFENSTHNETYKIEFYNLCRITEILGKEIKGKFKQINPNINSRYKRGLVNGLGNVVKFITGNLDNSDAERYNEAIEILSNKQNKMKTLVKEQVTLLEKSIDKFDNTTKILMHNQVTLSKKIYMLEQFISNNSIHFMDTYNYFLLNLIMTEIISSFELISNMLEKLEVAITFSKLNTFHNSIIKPEELLNEIKLISQHLVEGKLPFEPIIENILLYEKIINIKAYSENNKITFILEIPIVQTESYVYYHLYPLPIMKNNNFNMIMPSSKYVIVNENKFALFNEKCKEIITHEFICENMNILPIKQNVQCEIQLINYFNNVTNCKSIPIKLYDTQIRKLENSFWLISTPRLIVAKKYCKENVENIPINGSFLIDLGNSNCKIKVENMYIQQYKNNKMNFKLLNLPEININPKVNEDILEPVNMELVNIDSFKDIHDLINNQKERIKDINNVTLRNENKYIYILYCIILIIFICIVYYLVKNCIIRNKRKYNIIKMFKYKKDEKDAIIENLPVLCENSVVNPIVLQ